LKFFNTAGPVNQAEHYKIDPLKRWDTDEFIHLIGQKKYFILHAPRQTGKTSCLLALRDYLNKEGKYHCVYANFEVGQAARDNVGSGNSAVTYELHQEFQLLMGDIVTFTFREFIDQIDVLNAVGAYLSKVARLSDKPIVLLIDEIDSLVGDVLISVLRQLRTGYAKRPQNFPQSVILCGVRDVKDYRIQTSGKDVITGGSCFNIKSESLTLGNLSDREVRELYLQHTKETGQRFEEECFPLIMRYTNGQPWLVNALAYEVTYKMKPNRDPSVVITAAMISEAKERLILSRATHLDQLADKLSEDRVRRVIEPMIVGEMLNVLADDVEYCVDLGLVTKGPNGYQIMNQIYREVIPRELSKLPQRNFCAMFEPEWVKPDGSIDVDRFMQLFQHFWRVNSEIWAEDIAGYREAAPHLTFHAFLQRVSNGQGVIDREYGLGRKRADLVLFWKHPGGEQRVVIELKVFSERDSYEQLKEAALRQTAEYADKCDATDSNVVIFDRCNKTDWGEKVFTEVCEYNGRRIKIWGM